MINPYLAVAVIFIVGHRLVQRAAHCLPRAEKRFHRHARDAHPAARRDNRNEAANTLRPASAIPLSRQRRMARYSRIGVARGCLKGYRRRFERHTMGPRSVRDRTMRRPRARPGIRVDRLLWTVFAVARFAALSTYADPPNGVRAFVPRAKHDLYRLRRLCDRPHQFERSAKLTFSRTLRSNLGVISEHVLTLSNIQNVLDLARPTERLSCFP